MYEYGFFMLLSNVFFLLLTVAFGTALLIPVQSVIFYLAFRFIRQYAGGIHAKTETRCQIISTLAMFVSLLCIKLICDNMPVFFLTACIVAILASAVIFLLSPLDTEEKVLSAKERSHFKKITIVILAVLDLLVLVSYFFELEMIGVAVSAALILECILIAFGKMQVLWQVRKATNL